MIPRPNWAWRPVMFRSVTATTLVPPFCGSRWLLITAAAVPWPLASRAWTAIEAVCVSSSTSWSRAVPR